jgi:hypothetical protein
MIDLDLRDENLVKLEKIKEGLKRLKEELECLKCCDDSKETEMLFTNCRRMILQMQIITENNILEKDTNE